MSKRLIYFILGILSFSVRFFFESQSNIITGINGGYYPVQIMKIIEHGSLAMNDMPLVFYINALFVKLTAFSLPSFSIEYLTILTVKITGALSIPLLLFPLYKINSNLINYQLPKFFEYSIVVFCLFSFSPLYLSAEMMKNTYGLIGFTYFIYFVLKYINTKSSKYVLLIGCVLLLIGITHFGVFSISIIFLTISLICVYRKRAIIPISSILIIGFLIVWMLDPFRALNIFKNWIGLPWRIAYYPAGIVSFLIGIAIALVLFFIIKNKRIEKTQKQIFVILFSFIVLLSLPILNFELWRRFNFMLFIPKAIALILAYPYLKEHYKKSIPLVITSICGLALIYNILLPKKEVITNEAYNDLLNISNTIENPKNTLIVTRHGLEWWVVWQLETKISQPQIKIDDATIAKYDEILILRQKSGKFKLYPGPKTIFREPSVPNNNELLYSSNYYDLFRWSSQ